MLRNKIIRRIALVVFLIMLLTSTVNTTFGFVVTRTDSIINIFTPFNSIINNLIINKTVEHPLGDNYAIPDNITFNFSVNLGLHYANTKISTSEGEFTADENGIIVVAIRAGRSLTLNGIEADTKVTVTELIKEGSGFTAKDGKVTKEVVVSKDSNINLNFVNIYSPKSIQPLDVKVIGTKILQGRDWQKGDSFSFVLEQKTGEGTWKILGTRTIAYDASNSNFNQFDFSDIISALDFDKVGTYEFRMTETMGSLENVDYDKTVNTFSMVVTDVDMDGKLEINRVFASNNTAVSENDGDYTVSVVFNNTFVPPVSKPEDIEVKITAHKTINCTTATTVGPEGFEFILENVLSGEKLAVKSNNEAVAVFTLPFTLLDVGKTYNFKLYEIDQGTKGVTYDKSVYDISVTIALGEDNTLVANLTLNGNSVTNAVAEFINIYDSSVPDDPKTGDTSNLAFWFIMMLISASICVVIIVAERKYTGKHDAVK